MRYDGPIVEGIPVVRDLMSLLRRGAYRQVSYGIPVARASEKVSKGIARDLMGCLRRRVDLDVDRDGIQGYRELFGPLR
jgi:hypothetical protein